MRYRAWSTELMTGRRNLSVTAVGTDTDDLTRIARSIAGLGIEIKDEDLMRREHHYPYSPFGPEDERSETTITDRTNLAGEADVLELTVVEDAPAADRTLEAIGAAGLIGEDVLLVMIERDEDVITPRGESLLRPGSFITLFSPSGVSKAVVDAFADGVSAE